MAGWNQEIMEDLKRSGLSVEDVQKMKTTRQTKRR
jgi:hypothetical protein